MPNFHGYNVRAVGLPWCRKEDYSAFLSICEDAYGLPATWEEFTERSEKAENEWKAQGYIVERAYIDPDTFPDWCRQKGYRIDSEARRNFAADFALSKHGRNQS